MTDLSSLPDQLLASTLFVVDPAHRLFWAGLLSSAALALVVLKLQGRRLHWRVLRRVFLSRRYWLNASTLTDLRYFLVNGMVKALLATLFVSAQLVVTIAVAKALQQNLGTAHAGQLPWLFIAILYTVAFFVFEDLSRFLLHVAMHRVPLLWRLHRLHHGATTLTPLTVHRVHPLETCLYFLRGVLAFGLVSGLFVYLFGSRLSAIDILGVDALGFLFNMLGANLRHSHVWLSFGRLERVFVSPAQHQLHHSSDPRHADTNFGTCLALWDRLSGSWLAAGTTPQRLTFGLAALPRSGGGTLFVAD